MTRPTKSQILKYQAKIWDNPRFYCDKVLGGSRIWSKQEEILLALRDYPRVSVKSCHGSGKSFIAAREVSLFMHSEKNAIAITTAPTFRQVEDILWQEIRSAHAKAKTYDAIWGNTLQTRYDISDKWFAVGLSTDEPDRFQGYHGKRTLVVGDEASGIPRQIFEAIEGVLSTGFVRFLLIGNPTDPTGYFAETFKSDLWKHITISCFDTPNFATIKTIDQLRESTEEQRQKAVVMPFLITPQWAYERMNEWGEDSPLFQARVLGEFPKESDDTLIPLFMVERAMNREQVKQRGNDYVIGLDVARFGSDRTVFVTRRGNEVIKIDIMTKKDTNEVIGQAIQLLQNFPEAKMNVDEIGIGAGVLDALKASAYGSRVNGVNVAEKAEPDGTIQFANLRAKLSWTLRKAFYENDIILPEQDSMTLELTSVKYKFTRKGEILIEDKDEIKKRIGKSPDIMDALALAFYNPSGFSSTDDFAIV